MHSALQRPQDRRVGHFDGKENDEHRTRCSVTGKVMSTLLERKESLAQLLDQADDSAFASSPVSQDPFGSAVKSRASAVAFGERGSRQSLGTPLTASGRQSTAFGPRDLGDQLRWVRNVIDNVLALLPPDVRDGHFEDAIGFERVRHRVDLRDDDGSEPGFKVTVELYKKLFSSFNDFASAECEEGIHLVAEAVEAILKLRIKRVHACLLKTYLPTVLHILSRGNAFQALQRDERRAPAPTYMDFSQALCDLCRQSAMLEDLKDAIVTPCDDETFAGVLQYAEKLKAQIAETIINDEVIDEVAAELRSLSPDEGGEKCALLWRTMHEAVSYCTEFLAYSRPLVHAMERTRLIGLISHALVLKPPATSTAQRFAATTFHCLCRDASCLKSIIATVVSFPQAWEYLVPALYTNDVCVETEVADALVLMLDARQKGLHDAIFREAIEHFTMAIIQSDNATALLRVASALICEDPFSRFDDGGALYFTFHQTLVRACVRRLQLRAIGTRGKVPLIQYMDTLLALQCKEFASLMMELGVIRMLERLARSAERSMGVLYGVCMQPLTRLNRHFGFN